jgi:hypothetical protein
MAVHEREIMREYELRETERERERDPRQACYARPRTAPLVSQDRTRTLPDQSYRPTSTTTGKDQHKKSDSDSVCTGESSNRSTSSSSSSKTSSSSGQKVIIVQCSPASSSSSSPPAFNDNLLLKRHGTVWLLQSPNVARRHQEGDQKQRVIIDQGKCCLNSARLSSPSKAASQRHPICTLDCRQRQAKQGAGKSAKRHPLCRPTVSKPYLQRKSRSRRTRRRVSRKTTGINKCSP